MSRRDELRQASMMMYQKQTAPKSEQKRAEKVCGLCRNFRETAFTGEGKGACTVLKFGSNIEADPPKYVLDQENGYFTMNLMDATKCQYFEKMDFVDKDGTECSDPVYRRSMRQLQDG
ncbi:MAG: hypothetical protein HZB23_00505 [Deltaproteobacteria bacterium]|nr:hypothetical protein [Deltaproteobacteria bacterium]